MNSGPSQAPPEPIESQLQAIQQKLDTVVRFEIEARSTVKTALYVLTFAVGAAGLWINSQFGKLSEENKRLSADVTSTEDRLRDVEIRLGTTATLSDDPVAGVMVLADGIEREHIRGCINVVVHDLARSQSIVFDPLEDVLHPKDPETGGRSSEMREMTREDFVAELEKVKDKFRKFAATHDCATLAADKPGAMADLGIDTDMGEYVIVLTSIPVRFMEQVRSTFGKSFAVLGKEGAYRWSLADIGREVVDDVETAGQCGGIYKIIGAFDHETVGRRDSLESSVK